MDINDLLLLHISQRNKEEEHQKDVVFMKYFADEELRESSTLVMRVVDF